MIQDRVVAKKSKFLCYLGKKEIIEMIEITEVEEMEEMSTVETEEKDHMIEEIISDMIALQKLVIVKQKKTLNKSKNYLN